MTEPSASTDISPRPIDLTRRAVSPDAGLSPRATRVTPVDVGVFGGSGLYELFDDVEPAVRHRITRGAFEELFPHVSAPPAG